MVLEGYLETIDCFRKLSFGIVRLDNRIWDERLGKCFRTELSDFRAIGIVLERKLGFDGNCNGRLMCYDDPDIYIYF